MGGASRRNTLIKQAQTSAVSEPKRINTNFPETKNVIVPGTTIQVHIERNNKNSKWRFYNSNNAKKYELLNRNTETPRIRNINNVGPGNIFNQKTEPAPTRQTTAGPTKTIYEEYPLLKRVETVLNSVQNTENSTGLAQYKILQTPQGTGKRARFGKFMNQFNWAKLKNDQRLSAAQKKTVNKILISLKVPARDKFRNRPAITFNPNGMSDAQINQKVRASIATRPAAQRSPNANGNTFYNAKQTFNNPTFEKNNNAAQQARRQATEHFGNR